MVSNGLPRLYSRRYNKLIYERRSPPNLPSDQTIINAYNQTPPCDEDLMVIKGIALPPEAPIIYVKYGALHGVQGNEARSHQYAYDALVQIPPSRRGNVRIPEIYRSFTAIGPPGVPEAIFIVMEYVPGKTILQIMKEMHGRVNPPHLISAYHQIAHALDLFLSFKVPSDATPGPVGGGIIQHPLFKDMELLLNIHQSLNRKST